MWYRRKVVSSHTLRKKEREALDMFFSGKCEAHKHNVSPRKILKISFSSIIGVVEVGSKKWYLKSIKGTPKDTPSASTTSKFRELNKTGFAWMDFNVYCKQHWYQDVLV